MIADTGVLNMPRKKVEYKLKACIRCKKRPQRSKRAKRCVICHEIVRKEQLRKNNESWARRVAKGNAKHHLVYEGKPTSWALNNKAKALKLAQTQGLTDPSELARLLKKAS